MVHKKPFFFKEDIKFISHFIIISLYNKFDASKLYFIFFILKRFI